MSASLGGALEHLLTFLDDVEEVDYEIGDYRIRVYAERTLFGHKRRIRVTKDGRTVFTHGR